MSQYVGWLSLQPRPPRTGLAYVAVRVVVYLVALAVMVLLFDTKLRGLFIAPPVGLVSAAATWYLLGDTPLDARRRLINAGGVGVLLAELTWALGYWNVPALVGGAGLWLAFYVLSGVVENGASLSLDRRIAAEYALVALVGTGFILAIAHPWSV
jgi:hypothetical protein